MLWLGLAILMSAAIALVFRASEKADLNRYALTAVNYLTACVVSGVQLVFARRPEGPALRWALGAGAATGVFYFLSFIVYQVSVRRHGVALAGAVMKLGILVPAALSLVLFSERLAAPQWGGIAAAAAAILFIVRPPEGTRSVRPVLIALLFLGGLAEFGNKVFQSRGALEERAVFLLALFLTALAVSVVALAARRRSFGAREVAAGIAVGVPNQLGAFFLIRALAELPGAAVFPIYGAGTIVLLTLAGSVLYREKPGRRGWAVLFLCTAAVVLLGLG